MSSSFQFKLPDIGEGTAEAECVAWHVAVGDRVEEDQPLIDVMTDKATVEVTSPVTGVITERRGEVGDMLPVGGVILLIATSDSEDGAGPPAPAEAGPAAAEASEPNPTRGAASAHAPAGAKRVLTTPAVRRRARELGVDLSLVRPSGPNGRVRQADLDAYLDTPVAGPGPVSQEVVLRPASPDDAEFDEVPVVGLRRRIAERLQDTKRRIPHFSYIEEVEVGALERLRAEINAEAATGQPRLTLLPFLVRALVQTLRAFPQMNARYDDDAGVVRRYRAAHVGIATQTDAGLMVTVLRDAAGRDLSQTALEITRLSEAARSGRATREELGGSTITISSLGALGGLATTPVINSPEVAILGINKIVDRPVIREGRIEVARMMNLSASFDHRVIDGWDAALFVQRLKAHLESPAKLFMD